MTGSIHLPIHIELARQWNISTAFSVADTPGSHIYRVTLDDGSSAILKALKPGGHGELSGMTFLAWRNGIGAVRLLQQSGTVCLLEDAGRTTLRAYRLSHGEEASNAVIADILARLHAPGVTAPDTLTPLDEHFATLMKQEATEANSELRAQLQFAASAAREVLSAQKNMRPLHGDLHHDNIITGGLRGWLAIDPHGLIGDPAYDVANIFGNPVGALDDLIDPQRIRKLMALFATQIECTERKILCYAIAHAGLSICWSTEDGTSITESENARERLAFLKIARPMLAEDALCR